MNLNNQIMKNHPASQKKHGVKGTIKTKDGKW